MPARSSGEFHIDLVAEAVVKLLQEFQHRMFTGNGSAASDCTNLYASLSVIMSLDRGAAASDLGAGFNLHAWCRDQ